MIEVIKHIPEIGPMINGYFSKSTRADESGSNVGYFERISIGTKSKNGIFYPVNVIHHGFSSKLFSESPGVKNDSRGYKHSTVNPAMMPENDFVIKCLSRHKATKLSYEISVATEFFILQNNDKPEFGLFLKTEEGSKCVLISTKDTLRMAKDYHKEAAPEDKLFIEEIDLKVA